MLDIRGYKQVCVLGAQAGGECVPELPHHAVRPPQDLLGIRRAFQEQQVFSTVRRKIAGSRLPAKELCPVEKQRPGPFKAPQPPRLIQLQMDADQAVLTAGRTSGDVGKRAL